MLMGLLCIRKRIFGIPRIDGHRKLAGERTPNNALFDLTKERLAASDSSAASPELSFKRNHDASIDTVGGI